MEAENAVISSSSHLPLSPQNEFDAFADFRSTSLVLSLAICLPSSARTASTPSAAAAAFHLHDWWTDAELDEMTLIQSDEVTENASPTSSSSSMSTWSAVNSDEVKVTIHGEPLLRFALALSKLTLLPFPRRKIMGSRLVNSTFNC